MNPVFSSSPARAYEIRKSTEIGVVQLLPADSSLRSISSSRGLLDHRWPGLRRRLSRPARPWEARDGDQNPATRTPLGPIPGRAARPPLPVSLPRGDPRAEGAWLQFFPHPVRTKRSLNPVCLLRRTGSSTARHSPDLLVRRCGHPGGAWRLTILVGRPHAHGTGTTVLTDKRARCRRSRCSRTGRNRPRGGLFFPKKGFTTTDQNQEKKQERYLYIQPAEQLP